MPTFFGHRLRATIERKKIPFDRFARDLGISRATLYNWFERAAPPPSKRHQAVLVAQLGEPADYLLHGASKKVERAKDGWTLQEHGPQPMVASRLTPTPGAPSSRADCEKLFADLLDAAERTGNPNAFPVVHDWLRNNFPAHLRGEPKTE